MKCLHCQNIPKKYELYGMGKGCNPFRDEYELICPKCKKPYVVSYDLYYRKILGGKE